MRSDRQPNRPDSRSGTSRTATRGGAFVALCAALALGLAGSAAAKPVRRAGCQGVVLTPGADLQARITGSPGGTTFCLAPGLYRLSSALTLKTGDVLDGGNRAAILDGSKNITAAFSRSGSVWVAGGQTQSLTYDGQCEKAKPLCQQADDVFYDGKPLTRVGSAADVGPGTFFFDHAADRIVIGSTPVGHRVEATVTPEAIHGWGTGADKVTIRGLVVQHFALHGVQCRGDSWTVDSSVIRFNHGDGLESCANVVNSALVDNGKDGYVFGGKIGVSTGPYLFSHNTVTGNNYAGFDPDWEAGGAKFMQMSHLTVTHNLVTDNDGNGLWTDWGNQFVTYSQNVVEHNTLAGIFHEASYDATIANNVLSGNGDSCTSTLCNSAIMLNDSQNVSIFNNTLLANRNGIGMRQIDRGSTSLGPLVTQNVSVHDNLVARSGDSGLVQWQNDGGFYTSRNNRFSHNEYVVCGGGPSFVWQSPGRPDSYTRLSWTQWQAASNDRNGSYDCRTVTLRRTAAPQAGAHFSG